MARIETARAELKALERVMDLYYRGETLADALERVNTMVDEHNRLVDEKNRELDVTGAKVDAAREPLDRLKAEIERMDARLKRQPDPNDRAAVADYNALAKRRNAAVRRFNSMNDGANAVVAFHNARVKEVKAELRFASGLLDAARAEYKAKTDARDAFEKPGKDVAFFESLNRFLGRTLAEARKTGAGDGWTSLAGDARALRRELGLWATADYARKEHGLVVVEAAVSGEPCWFIVDTGAMRTTIGPGILDAIGLSDRLGDEIELVLAGGMRTKGRAVTLPSIKVSGSTERDVPAAAVKVSEVGIDGLLGQSFLKRFVYTIDESTNEKLLLRPKEKGRRPGR